MSASDHRTASRACDLLLREAISRNVPSIRLEPEDDSYVIYTVTEEKTEQVMAPSQHAALGIFVEFCHRAGVEKETCRGQFAFSHEGRPHTVQMQVVNCPQGKGAVITLGEDSPFVPHDLQ